MDRVRSVQTALPVVDLNDEPERLRQVAHDVGFFYLTGHGVPSELSDRVLAAARRFFALPQAAKDAVAMTNSPHFRGYTRLGGEFTAGRIDWREQIDIGPERTPPTDPVQDYLRLQGPNQWPEGLPELPGVIAQWDAELARVGRVLLQRWASGLGADPGVFDAAFADVPATLIKIVRYPAQAETTQGVGAHRDAGVLTLLLAEPGSEGLQVRGSDGTFIDVDPLSGAFIVNIGEMLEFASGGYLRATEHRVQVGAAERISVPYFFNPRLDAGLPVLTLPEELAARARGVTADPSNDRIYPVYGRNAWKSRVRAHPDVAAAHGYM
ncbi:isopenicillin N synthase family oxygenase [Mycobacterium sp. CBMA247]|nr:2-oxoglutarate and iron-dependent oxygenase domain-containing protein [Mycolicibacterium sp. CBMA 295]MUL82603.1 isopenicillin N synthase family oxygenase [Mycolicibacterium sp. CBMA 329]MUL88938.1 isopenicillin N synthase family oxygenase [Mycolicibacterium sp. CBMA 331]MUL97505.1 isopenicillin N synthase family oxygenase [Mycolicibacterium sp. CBMA 334]MUM38454.1 isopenicillin N synthase family oxygenase [Mycolicibacterium sp. CBMA 247]MUM45002.1 isopenicillin N synthase family oxygenase 